MPYGFYRSYKTRCRAQPYERGFQTSLRTHLLGALQESGAKWGLTKKFFGTQLEIGVAGKVEIAQQGWRRIAFGDVRWTGRGNNAHDFTFVNRRQIDITTNNASTVQKHLNRPEIDSVVTYPSLTNAEVANLLKHAQRAPNAGP